MSYSHRGCLNPNADQSQGSEQPVYLSKLLVKWEEETVQADPITSYIPELLCKCLPECSLAKSFISCFRDTLNIKMSIFTVTKLNVKLLRCFFFFKT